MDKQIINYLRSRGLEPIEKDITFFTELVDEKTEDIDEKLKVAHDNLDLILASGACDKENTQRCYRGLGFDEQYIESAS